MKRTVLAIVLITLAPVLFAETIRFDPPNATAHHSVDAIVSGIWPHSCVPSVKGITFAGSTIVLRLNTAVPPEVSCAQATTQYARTFHLEVLSAGTYTVITLADDGNNVTELTRTPLIVRDAETLSIEPYAVPVSGGQIVIKNPLGLAGSRVTIGGVQVASTDLNGQLIVNAPAHAAGAVDVDIFPSFCDPCPPATIATAALIYYDPASADPAVFEPILFPFSFEGPGSFGSQWTTQSFILAGSSRAFFRDPLPCTGCSAVLSASAQLNNDGNPWGRLLYAIRGTTETVDYSSRIHDISRQSSTVGAEVPIVRERDFRGQLRFVNVPVDGRFRTTLRMWSLGDFPEYHVLIGSDSTPVTPLYTARIPGTAMWFGSIDLTPMLLQLKTSPVNVTVYPSGFGSKFLPLFAPPIWGMLSITNNASQQVTIISPQ